MADQRVGGNKLSLFLIIFTISQTTAEFGLLNVRNSNDPNVLPKDYCLTYNPLYQDLPKTIEESKYYSYLSLLPDFLCHEPESPERLADKIVVVMRGNCTFTEKATLVQASNGNAVVVASKDALVTPHGNESAGDYDNINIPVALIRYDDAEEIQGKGDGIVAALYAPAETTRVDYNLILIWLIAVGTVVIGAYWSGLTAHRIDKKRMLRRKRGDAESAKDEEDEDEAQSIDVSAVMVIIFVVMIVSMLLLLYFFYDYIVYVIILFFCVAAAAGIHACLLPFIRMIPLGSYKWMFHLIMSNINVLHICCEPLKFCHMINDSTHNDKIVLPYVAQCFKDPNEITATRFLVFCCENKVIHNYLQEIQSVVFSQKSEV
uniref:Signal peptide peptidase-like 2B-like n=1 Tax=Saccoglossus kowalevskii TaxID=10224 RepID=A0ABM0M787_SACKO|nr:PREDICTED: signal peptide peptidase-like 2B-like [Saccoglossus kowalevskii]